MEIILVIIVLAILFWLLKKIWHLLRKGISALPKLSYYSWSLSAIICTKIFYGITKIFHIQSFIYYVLGFFSPPSLIYLCKIHIPYSKKEKFIDVKDSFIEKKKQRDNVIAMSFFYTLTGVALILMQYLLIDDEDDASLLGVGIIYAVIAFVYVFYKISQWNKENSVFYERCIEWRKWSLGETDTMLENDVEEKILAFTKTLSENDNNRNIFTAEEMPYGRATAFISYFRKNLDNENPMYFSAKMSSDEDELREYGILVTTKGIYMSKQGEEDIEIPFEGLFDICSDGEKWYLDYGLSFGNQKIVCVDNAFASVEFGVLADMLGQMKDISLALFQGKVKTELDEAFEVYETKVEEAQRNFETKQKTSDIAQSAALAGIGASLKRNADVYDTVKNNFDGKQGHGTAAEYANNIIDNLNPFNRAQHLGSNNAKNGPDRNVNGVNIQTKYKETAGGSIGAAFEDGKAKYLNDDGSMMQIEVPRDQYHKAVDLMKKRIEDGQVPGETNPENAKNYVRRGHITYLQAYNIAGSGSIESITFDALQGIVCAVPGAGITTILTFATAVWNGAEIKDAAKVSVIAGFKVVGKADAIYTLTMQLSRGKVVNLFYPLLKNAGNNSVKKYTTNYIAKGANSVAKQISKSSLAKSKVGKAVGLDKVTGKQVISGTITSVIVYGPDVCKAFQGKISGKQLIKNSTISTSGLIGASLGAAIPIPIVGSMIGGAVGSFVEKKVMDAFVEDDSVTMFRIMREELLDIVMLYSFNTTEFDEIVNATIGNENIPKVLQSMYQSGEPKNYADALINTKVQFVLAKREKITTDKIEQGMKYLLEDTAVA